MRESLEGVLTSQLEENFKEVRDSMEAIGFSKQVLYSLAKCYLGRDFLSVTPPILKLHTVELLMWTP